MKREAALSRRQMLASVALGGAALGLAGCDRLSNTPASLSILDSAENLTRRVQRALLAPRDALAPEYSPADLSKTFKPNGSTDPDDPDYVKNRDEQFANWKLDVGGLIDNPMQLSLADLRDLPSRTQITRHDCVEGWSCIGKWKGAPARADLEDGRAEAFGALHRVLLRRHAGADARRDRTILRDDRSRRRFSSADDPRL